jgi:hypothetical protein
VYGLLSSLTCSAYLKRLVNSWIIGHFDVIPINILGLLRFVVMDESIALLSWQLGYGDAGLGKSLIVITFFTVSCMNSPHEPVRCKYKKIK